MPIGYCWPGILPLVILNFLWLGYIGPSVDYSGIHVSFLIDQLFVLFLLRRPQLLLFSTTIPDWVSRTAGSYMSKNKKVVDMIGQDKVKTAIAVEVCIMDDMLVHCCNIIWL